MAVKTVLTGVKATGTVHIGNYLGAMRPAIQMARQQDVDSLLFIADYHGLTTIHEGAELRELTYQLAAAWLACGLDPEVSTIYRQSDVPETFELQWILSCFTAKGLMNRAHAYKAKVQENQNNGKQDLDFGVNMGLYSYPVLMAADILLFGADEVPVGEDQTQHLEITRDIAERFNRNYGDVLRVPKVVVQKDVKTIPGLDGRKMSKSYDNIIPLFCDPKKLRKLVMKIKTDSSAPEDPKDPDDSLIFDLYREFASLDQIKEMKEQYNKGIAWGHAKQALFEVMDGVLQEPREKYNELMNDKNQLDQILEAGAEKARRRARSVLGEVRSVIGMKGYS